jgi:hypothetical protein
MTSTATTPGSRSTSAAGVRRLPRTTGAFSALAIIALGAWAALIPFIGPYFHYGFGPNHAWHYSTGRLWLDILPGVAAVVGGLMLLRSAHRVSGLVAGWLAVAAGAWLVVGPSLSLLWHHAGNPIGAPIGGYFRHAVEEIGFFTGPGLLIAVLAAFAMGRFVSRPHLAVEAAGAAGIAAADAGETHTTERRGLFRRRRRLARNQAEPPPA